ncbi:MAG TPA: SRPBCC family protein [Solirubrobacterales bacterium]|nr:SRPBCC family protein [Solirubrobacterales bacterium]
MNTDTRTRSVTQETTVKAPIERTFRFFTEEMERWWNPDHHILEAPIARMVLEPRVGGAIYDVGTDGSECRWARVLAYDPPHRFTFSWDIGLDWKVEPDPARASEVEVLFSEAGSDLTRVELTHRHLDRHGDGWEQMREAISSPGGWPAGLGRFTAWAEEQLVMPPRADDRT